MIGGFRARLVAVALVLACGAFIGCSEQSAADEGDGGGGATPVLTLGEPETLLGDGELGLSYFPDMGTSALETETGVRLVLASVRSTFVVEGADLQNLSKATAIVAPGAPGEFDNGYAGVSAVVRVEGVYYGFYHAEDQEGLPLIPGSDLAGFYGSIGLVTSEDGLTWTKRGQVITSSQPKEWAAYPNQSDRGAAEPGAVVSRDGRYVFLYYTEHSRVDGRSVDICVARADLQAGPPLPGAFSKYRNGGFSEPGLGGHDSPIVVGPAPTIANALEGHVVYSKAADRYLMIFGVDDWDARMKGRPPELGGLYAAWSTDGVVWAEPKRLIADQGVPQEGRSLSWEGSVLWDDDTGTTGTLIYGYTPNWQSPGHYMVGRRLTVSP
jgi:hypothetical protein